MPFRAQNILVTGGSGGLGALICADLKRQSATVTVLDRVAPEGDYAHIPGDLSSAEGLEAAAQAISGQSWDRLINLAGIQHFGPVETQAPGHLIATYMINLVAPVRLTQAVLPGMKARVGAYRQYRLDLRLDQLRPFRHLFQLQGGPKGL